MALTITELVDTEIITPMQMAEKMSYNPAKILHLDKKGDVYKRQAGQLRETDGWKIPAGNRASWTAQPAEKTSAETGRWKCSWRSLKRAWNYQRGYGEIRNRK